jgi:hypothetical protein
MREAVRSDLMTPRLGLHHQPGVAGHVDTLDEEGRSQARTIERVEHARCPLGMWPVVERQRDGHRQLLGSGDKACSVGVAFSSSRPWVVFSQ